MPDGGVGYRCLECWKKIERDKVALLAACEDTIHWMHNKNDRQEGDVMADIMVAIANAKT